MIEIPPPPTKTRLSGWSGYLEEVSEINYVNNELIQETIANNNEKYIARGHGCSFGDQAILKSGIVLSTNRLKEIKWITDEIISVESGVELRELLSELLPRNKTLVGIPGGLQITIGGAISNNIHGKDHWKNGNFSENILSITFIDQDGNKHKVSKQDEVFKYLIGGMGLFGLIISAELKTYDIKSPWIREDTIRLNSKYDFEEFFTSIKNRNLDIDYAVAWLDFSNKRHLGRGIALTGKFIDGKKVTKNYVEEKTKFNKYVFNYFHHNYFWSIARPFYKRPILNSLSLIKYKLTKQVSSSDIFYTDYMWIDNKFIPEYRKIYKPKNFVEVQPLIPINDGYEKFFELLDYLKFNRLEPLFPSVKIHKEHESLWTFAGDGLSICIDIPVARKNFTKTINELYQFLIDIDARVYLAKDSTLDKKFTNKLAPGFNELIEKSNELNFAHKFCSNMVNRLKD